MSGSRTGGGDHIVGHEGGRETLSGGLDNVFEWSQFWNIMCPRFEINLCQGARNVDPKIVV